MEKARTLKAVVHSFCGVTGGNIMDYMVCGVISISFTAFACFVSVTCGATLGA
jgi:hypothetical protein